MAGIIAIVGGLFLLVYLKGRSEGATGIGDAIAGGFSSLSQDVQASVGGALGDPVAVALPIIKQFEGFSSKAYPDPPGSGKYSIGYGHQIQPDDPYDQNSTIGIDDAVALLQQDVQTAYDDVIQQLNVDPSTLTTNQLAALTSFRYNVGSGAFGSSTLLRLINEGDTESAAEQFSKWVYSGGSVSGALVSRRQQETELFNA